MIKRIRGVPPVALTADRGGKRATTDDVQRLLVEQWKRASIKEKVAAKQRRLVSAAPTGEPLSLKEMTAVTRIGSILLLRRLRSEK